MLGIYLNTLHDLCSWDTDQSEEKIMFQNTVPQTMNIVAFLTRFTELLSDLLSFSTSLPIRRFLNALLDDCHLKVYIRRARKGLSLLGLGSSSSLLQQQVTVPAAVTVVAAATECHDDSLEFRRFVQ